MSDTNPTVFGVENDGTPRALLDIAGQAVRAFNHQTDTVFHTYRDGWNYVSDAYRCIGELTYLFGGVKQAIDHLAKAMQRQAAAGHVGAAPGGEYDGRPGAAIDAAGVSLDSARASADNVYRALEHAQNSISRIHYAGPGLDGDDDD